MTSTHHRLLGLAVLAAGIAACGSSPPANKSGARVERNVTLTLEMPDAGDAQGRYFADAVRRRSHGNVRINIDTEGYLNVVPADENKLPAALVAGREQLGFLPARAWAAHGVGAFKALLAPFAVASEESTVAVASGAAGRQALAALPPEVVGVGLIPAEPRRIMATRALRSAADFRGLRVRVPDNPQSAADFEALGAVPVMGLSGDKVDQAFEHKRLDAIETVPERALANRYYRFTKHLTAYAIFPKLQTIVVNRNVWTRLSHEQRTAITAAARDTLEHATRALPKNERAELALLCRQKVEVTPPTPAEMKALAQSAKPATDALAANGSSAPLLAALGALPGAGPQGSASPLPDECLAAGAGAPTAERVATIPDGVYVTTDTVADFRAEGVHGDDWNQAITFTTTLHDGRMRITQKPDYADQGPMTGTYTVDGDQVVFHYTAVTGGEWTDTVKWSYYDRALRFQVVLVTDGSARAQYIAHPWRKVR
ncbi:MAG TPA: TRAP transporter substrate-binding protein DctP [Solirubrobacter sp.]